MDENTEARLTLLQKIASSQNSIEYYRSQIAACTQALNQSISINDQETINQVTTALKETQSNLNSEQRMLNILNSRLQSGNYNLGVSSSLGKRAFEK